MNYVILALLLCIPSLSFARSWEESFAEAAEKRSKIACQEVEERMDSNCWSCDERRRKRLYDGCIEAVEEARAEEKEKRDEEKVRKDEEKARIAELNYVESIMKQQPIPNVELSCTMTQSSFATVFDRIMELKIWNTGVCSGGFGRHTCNISTAQYSGATRSRSWALSRATGEMSVQSNNDINNTAVYNCQRVTERTNKF